ncbi:uncharacterized protein LOC134541974 isoform X2 [Bacillus rossius redtenbacheri]|uniref:uncharacterized protein LOC134541974 isoform X2 n=1 Tax=Bacillus rossius redtenbacheri TaxID=93214 RepID=UPI002FDD0A12
MHYNVGMRFKIVKGLVVFGYHLERQLLAVVGRVESFLESLERGRPQGEGPTPRSSRGKRSRARGKQAQLRSAESLADLLTGSDLPEPLSD